MKYLVVSLDSLTGMWNDVILALMQETMIIWIQLSQDSSIANP